MTNLVFDIETTSLFGSDGRTKLNDISTLMWTIGEVVVDDSGHELLDMKTVYANGYDDVPNVLQKLSDKFSEYRPMKLITFNGSKFDLPVVRRGFVDNDIQGRPFKDANHVDVYTDLIVPNLYFSTAAKVKSLKTLSERWLGRKYSMDGKMFFTLYDQWLETGDDELLFDLIEYNRADVQNTYDIYKRLLRFIPNYWTRGKSL